MNLDHDFFQVSKLSEDQKMERFFPSNSGKDLRSDAHQSQNVGGGGVADEDHTQIIGGIQSNYWGDISPLGFGTPACMGVTFIQHRIGGLLFSKPPIKGLIFTRNLGVNNELHIKRWILSSLTLELRRCRFRHQDFFILFYLQIFASQGVNFF